MRKLSVCQKCGGVPECLTIPSGRRNEHGRLMNYYEVRCECGQRTGRSMLKNEACEDWNSKQECLKRAGEEDD